MGGKKNLKEETKKMESIGIMEITEEFYSKIPEPMHAIY